MPVRGDEMGQETSEFSLEVAAGMLRDLNAPWVCDLGLRLESITTSPSSDVQSNRRVKMASIQRRAACNLSLTSQPRLEKTG